MARLRLLCLLLVYQETVGFGLGGQLGGFGLGGQLSGFGGTKDTKDMGEVLNQLNNANQDNLKNLQELVDQNKDTKDMGKVLDQLNNANQDNLNNLQELVDQNKDTKDMGKVLNLLTNTTEDDLKNLQELVDQNKMVRMKQINHQMGATYLLDELVPKLDPGLRFVLHAAMVDMGQLAVGPAQMQLITQFLDEANLAAGDVAMKSIVKTILMPGMTKGIAQLPPKYKDAANGLLTVLAPVSPELSDMAKQYGLPTNDTCLKDLGAIEAPLVEVALDVPVPASCKAHTALKEAWTMLEKYRMLFKEGVKSGGNYGALLEILAPLNPELSLLAKHYGLPTNDTCLRDIHSQYWQQQHWATSSFDIHLPASCTVHTKLKKVWDAFNVYQTRYKNDPTNLVMQILAPVALQAAAAFDAELAKTLLELGLPANDTCLSDIAAQSSSCSSMTDPKLLLDCLRPEPYVPASCTAHTALNSTLSMVEKNHDMQIKAMEQVVSMLESGAGIAQLAPAMLGPQGNSIMEILAPLAIQAVTSYDAELARRLLELGLPANDTCLSDMAVKNSACSRMTDPKMVLDCFQVKPYVAASCTAHTALNSTWSMVEKNYEMQIKAMQQMISILEGSASLGPQGNSIMEILAPLALKAVADADIELAKTLLDLGLPAHDTCLRDMVAKNSACSSMTDPKMAFDCFKAKPYVAASCTDHTALNGTWTEMEKTHDMQIKAMEQVVSILQGGANITQLATELLGPKGNSIMEILAPMALQAVAAADNELAKTLLELGLPADDTCLSDIAAQSSSCSGMTDPQMVLDCLFKARPHVPASCTAHTAFNSTWSMAQKNYKMQIKAMEQVVSILQGAANITQLATELLGPGLDMNMAKDYVMRIAKVVSMDQTTDWRYQVIMLFLNTSLEELASIFGMDVDNMKDLSVDKLKAIWSPVWQDFLDMLKQAQQVMSNYANTQVAGEPLMSPESQQELQKAGQNLLKEAQSFGAHMQDNCTTYFLTCLREMQGSTSNMSSITVFDVGYCADETIYYSRDNFGMTLKAELMSFQQLLQKILQSEWERWMDRLENQKEFRGFARYKINKLVKVVIKTTMGSTTLSQLELLTSIKDQVRKLSKAAGITIDDVEDVDLNKLIDVNQFAKGFDLSGLMGVLKPAANAVTDDYVNNSTENFSGKEESSGLDETGVASKLGGLANLLGAGKVSKLNDLGQLGDLASQLSEHAVDANMLKGLMTTHDILMENPTVSAILDKVADVARSVDSDLGTIVQFIITSLINDPLVDTIIHVLPYASDSKLDSLINTLEAAFFKYDLTGTCPETLIGFVAELKRACASSSPAKLGHCIEERSAELSKALNNACGNIDTLYNGCMEHIAATCYAGGPTPWDIPFPRGTSIKEPQVKKWAPQAFGMGDLLGQMNKANMDNLKNLQSITDGAKDIKDPKYMDKVLNQMTKANIDSLSNLQKITEQAKGIREPKDMKEIGDLLSQMNKLNIDNVKNLQNITDGAENIKDPKDMGKVLDQVNKANILNLENFQKQVDGAKAGMPEPTGDGVKEVFSGLLSGMRDKKQFIACMWDQINDNAPVSSNTCPAFATAFGGVSRYPGKEVLPPVIQVPKPRTIKELLKTNKPQIFLPEDTKKKVAELGRSIGEIKDTKTDKFVLPSFDVLKNLKEDVVIAEPKQTLGLFKILDPTADVFISGTSSNTDDEDSQGGMVVKMLPGQESTAAISAKAQAPESYDFAEIAQTQAEPIAYTPLSDVFSLVRYNADGASMDNAPVMVDLYFDTLSSIKIEDDYGDRRALLGLDLRTKFQSTEAIDAVRESTIKVVRILSKDPYVAQELKPSTVSLSGTIYNTSKAVDSFQVMEGGAVRAMASNSTGEFVVVQAAPPAAKKNVDESETSSTVYWGIFLGVGVVGLAILVVVGASVRKKQRAQAASSGYTAML